jgi:CheY-like chemotaxis protein
MRHVVLIVDDDDDSRALLEAVLSDAGYETVVARNGLEGLQRLAESHPSLVLLDLQMPLVTGWEFRSRQLNDPRTEHVPVIAVTGCFEPLDVALKLGIRCLVKPFDITDLLQEVHTACERALI